MRTFLQYLAEGRAYIGSFTGFDEVSGMFRQLSLEVDEEDGYDCIQRFKELVLLDNNGNQKSGVELFIRTDRQETSLTTFSKRKKTDVLPVLTFVIRLSGSATREGEKSSLFSAITNDAADLKKDIFNEKATSLPKMDEPEYFFASASEYGKVVEIEKDKKKKVGKNNLVIKLPQTTMKGKADMEFAYFRLTMKETMPLFRIKEPELEVLGFIRVHFVIARKNQTSTIHSTYQFLNDLGFDKTVTIDSKKYISVTRDDLNDFLKADSSGGWESRIDSNAKWSDIDKKIHKLVMGLVSSINPASNEHKDVNLLKVVPPDLKDTLNNVGVSGYAPIIAEYLIPFLLLRGVQKISGTQILGDILKNDNGKEDEVEEIQFPVSSSNPLTDYNVVFAKTSGGNTIRISAKSRQGGYNPPIFQFFDENTSFGKKALEIVKTDNFDAFSVIYKVVNYGDKTNGRFSQAVNICFFLNLYYSELSWKNTKQMSKEIAASPELLKEELKKCVGKMNSDSVLQDKFYELITHDMEIGGKSTKFIQIELNNDFSISIVGRNKSDDKEVKKVQFIADKYLHNKSGLIKFKLLS